MNARAHSTPSPPEGGKGYRADSGAGCGERSGKSKGERPFCRHFEDGRNALTHATHANKLGVVLRDWKDITWSNSAGRWRGWGCPRKCWGQGRMRGGEPRSCLIAVSSTSGSTVTRPGAQRRLRLFVEHTLVLRREGFVFSRRRATRDQLDSFRPPHRLVGMHRGQRRESPHVERP